MAENAYTITVKAKDLASGTLTRISDKTDSLGKSAKGSGDMWGTFTGVLGAVGVFSVVSKGIDLVTDSVGKLTSFLVTDSLNAFYDYEAGLSGMRKTLGLTKDEAFQVGDALTRIETPTTIAELQKIAAVGGTFGVTKDDVIGFTEAIDKAYVALGEDFNGSIDETVSSLVKVKDSFKDTKDLKIEDAIARIGSAINVLGTDGAATSANIADFAKRISKTVGSMDSKTALAFGAALESLGIDAQIASGGLSEIFFRGAKGVDKFAKVLGLSKKEMTSLIDTDPVGFITKLSEKMKGMGQTEATTFLADLDVNTKEAVGTMMALATNTTKLTDAVKLSNDAFSAGESLQAEYTSATDNTRAQQEMMANSLMATQIALGELWNKFLVGSGLLTTINTLINEGRQFFEGFSAGVSERGEEIKTKFNEVKDKVVELLTKLGLMGPTTSSSFDAGYGAGDNFVDILLRVLDEGKKVIQIFIDNKDEIKKAFDNGVKAATILWGVGTSLIGVFATFYDWGFRIKRKMDELVTTAKKLATVFGQVGLASGAVNTSNNIQSQVDAAVGGGHYGGIVKGFKTGGFVSGPRFGTGRDNIMVRAEEGEAILTKKQQSGLINQLDNNGQPITINNYFNSNMDVSTLATRLAFQLKAA